jgi:hypothetical protein
MTGGECCLIPRRSPLLTTADAAAVAFAVDVASAQKHRVNFVEVTRGTFFYQCVYLLVAKDAGIMAAAAAARSVFGMTTSPYMPHLSLLYADLTEAEKSKVRLT